MDHSIFPEALSLLGLQNISLLIACLTSYASFFYFADSSISPQLSSDIGPQVPLPFVSFLPVLSPLAILSILMDVNAINRLMLRSYIFKVKLFPKLQVYKTNCHLDILDKYKNWTFNLYSRYVHLILLFISVYENCILSTDRVKKKKKKLESLLTLSYSLHSIKISSLFYLQTILRIWLLLTTSTTFILAQASLTKITREGVGEEEENK